MSEVVATPLPQRYAAKKINQFVASRRSVKNLDLLSPYVIGAGTLFGAASGAGILKAFSKFFNTSMPKSAYTLAAIQSGLIGGMMPLVMKSYINKDPNADEKTDKIIDISKSLSMRSNPLEKKSALGDVVPTALRGLKSLWEGSITRLGVGAVKNVAVPAAKDVAKLYWAGLRPAQKTWGTGRKAWGLAVKGGTVGGAAYLGHRSYQNYAASPYSGIPVGASESARSVSGPTYTTYLRNQVLRGNIKPEELSPEDLSNVRRLGMR